MSPTPTDHTRPALARTPTDLIVRTEDGQYPNAGKTNLCIRCGGDPSIAQGRDAIGTPGCLCNEPTFAPPPPPPRKHIVGWATDRLPPSKNTAPEAHWTEREPQAPLVPAEPLHCAAGGFSEALDAMAEGEEFERSRSHSSAR